MKSDESTAIAETDIQQYLWEGISRLPTGDIMLHKLCLTDIAPATSSQNCSGSFGSISFFVNPAMLFLHDNMILKR